MDVSFTNVLEGARQYFQGLPATPAQGDGTPYNPGGQLPPATDRGGSQPPDQRPPSNDTNRSTPTSENFQFQRPQSRDVRDPSPRSHTPSSREGTPRAPSRESPRDNHEDINHKERENSTIMPNPMYNSLPTTQNQTYHQLQPSYTNNYQMAQSPTQTITKTTTNNYLAKGTGFNYPVVPTNTQLYPQDKQVNSSYYKQNYYNNNQNKPSQGTYNNQYTSQAQTYIHNNTTTQVKATHNLPPIAALSSVNYTRNAREALRLKSATAVLNKEQKGFYQNKTSISGSVGSYGVLQNTTASALKPKDFYNNQQENNPYAQQFKDAKPDQFYNSQNQSLSASGDFAKSGRDLHSTGSQNVISNNQNVVGHQHSLGQQQSATRLHENVSGHQQNVTAHQQNVSGHQQSVTGHQNVSGHQQSVVGHQNVIGHQPSVSRHQENVSSHLQNVANQNLSSHNQNTTLHNQSATSYQQNQANNQIVTSQQQNVTGYQQNMATHQQTVNSLQQNVSNQQSMSSHHQHTSHQENLSSSQQNSHPNMSRSTENLTNIRSNVSQSHQGVINLDESHQNFTKNAHQNNSHQNVANQQQNLTNTHQTTTSLHQGVSNSNQNVTNTNQHYQNYTNSSQNVTNIHPSQTQQSIHQNTTHIHQNPSNIHHTQSNTQQTVTSLHQNAGNFNQNASNPTQVSSQNYSNQNYSNQATSNQNDDTKSSTDATKQVKRESPLDLSVKTVRTSADSTLDDREEDRGIKNRVSSHGYPTYGFPSQFPMGLGTPRSTHGEGPPKIDFLPNFNVSSLNQNRNQQQREPIQHGYQRMVTERQNYTHGASYQHLKQSSKYPQSIGRSQYPNQTMSNQQMVNQMANQQLANQHLANQQMVNQQVTNQHINQHINQTNQGLARKMYDSHVGYEMNKYHQQKMSQYNVPNPKRLQELPRIEFPPPGHKTYPVNTQEINRKRSADMANAILPQKIPKMDQWKHLDVIDQQIEQKLNSYVKSKLQQDTSKIVNGLEKSKENKSIPQQYQMHQYQRTSTVIGANNNNNKNIGGAADKRVLHLLRNSLEIKGAKEAQRKMEIDQQKHMEHISKEGRHHPHLVFAGQNVYNNQKTHGYPRHPTSNVYGHQNTSTSGYLPSNYNNKVMGYDGQYPMGALPYPNKFQSQLNLKQPSTDVTAPYQPKSTRQVSPFTASLVDRNGTPPNYKFHVPKAIDSVKMEDDVKAMYFQDNKMQDGTAHSGTDLDGLAAFLAARIRTKAELKQVGHTQQNMNNNLMGNDDLTPSKTDVSSTASSVSPPKFAKERSITGMSPRRKLFAKSDEDLTHDGVIKNVPLRDKSGLRSSSETSVFDFPDSDSEIDISAHQKRSLEDMRRDRKSIHKSGDKFEIKQEQESRPATPTSYDNEFDMLCNNFLEQLKQGTGKKRTRRKKQEPQIVQEEKPPPEVKVKIELENPFNSDKENQVDFTKIEIKVEAVDPEDQEEAEKNKPEPIKNEDTDSDVPLSNIKKKPVDNEALSDNEEEIVMKRGKLGAKVKIESSSDSEIELEVAIGKVKKCKKKSPVKLPPSIYGKPGKKPIFGDGTDFHPGWEEELYKYKAALRMPASLIHVTRPPNCQRLSTSLPDLDMSPTPSSTGVEATSKTKLNKVKIELESDLESNSSFNFSFGRSNYDSEEGSIKSFKMNEKNSEKIKEELRKKESGILDKLLERYGGNKKRKKIKKKEEMQSPKVIPKSENTVELLPTPSLEIDDAKNKVIKSESVLLNFRKKTVDNFKDAFINTPKNIVDVNAQFTTVVLKSRTRKQTRVLKQKATIREVFGDDRPASAPPVTCLEDLKSKEIQEEVKPTLDDFLKDKVSKPSDFKNKFIKGRKSENLLKSLVHKSIKVECMEDDRSDTRSEMDTKSEIDTKSEMDKSETPSLDGDDGIVTKRRSKFGKIRRKFSSGFDYIRKKKKIVKKENNVDSEMVKPKRGRGLATKGNIESVQDIQKEIKSWVLNKGIGETHLHRAARLGFTDITAYCLEKMNCHPTPKDNAGYTPLHEACSRGHLDIAKLLLSFGSHVSESALGGIRPLHEAIENGFVEIVRLLLSYGADPLLATYNGTTPLSLANDQVTAEVLQDHIDDLQGISCKPMLFTGPATCFDPEEYGYNPLDDVPKPDATPDVSEEEIMDFEVSETPLPNLYSFKDEPVLDRWILLQDLSSFLKIKSRDALLKQINPPSTAQGDKQQIREMKMSEFLESAHCCQFLNANEKLNLRASKIALVKYTDRIKQLLNVEQFIVDR